MNIKVHIVCVQQSVHTVGLVFHIRLNCTEEALTNDSAATQHLMMIKN